LIKSKSLRKEPLLEAYTPRGWSILYRIRNRRNGNSIPAWNFGVERCL